MEIVDARDTSVALGLQFIKPFRSESTIRFSLEPDEDGTEVVWTLTGPRTFMTRVMGLFTSMDKMVGPDFERGLERLQADVGAAADPA